MDELPSKIRSIMDRRGEALRVCPHCRFGAWGWGQFTCQSSASPHAWRRVKSRWTCTEFVYRLRGQRAYRPPFGGEY